MPRTIKAAAVQMDAAPAPVTARLERAADLIAEAASAGAQLVVLPELFNAGYHYHDDNYRAAEPPDGQTVTWMIAQAAQHRVHIAGTLLLLDEEDVYNTALLVAPDGRIWRYDKQYPWLWERAYFREGRRITVAQTDLGKIGMMICWDAAHAEVWERYAGKVDALVIMSCPPKMSAADLVFPDGERVNLRDLGSVYANMYTDEECFPGKDMDAHAAWLRVPVIHTAGAGRFRSKLPLSHISLAGYIAARDDLWTRLSEAPDVVIETGYDPQTKVIDSNGRVLARVTTPGDGYTLADVALADAPPQPNSPPPPMQTAPEAYFLSDLFGAHAVIPLYRRGVRRQWGARMAPFDPRTKVWAGVALGTLALGWLIGRSKR